MYSYRKNYLMKELIKKLEKFGQDLEKFNMAEYLQLINSSRRFLWINFLAGLARGFGFALGATILGAIAIMGLQRLVVLNLPIIGDYIAEIVKIVYTHL